MIDANQDWIKAIDSGIYIKTDINTFHETLRKTIENTFYKILCRYSNRKDKILEAGCGMAYISFALVKEGFQTTALDISENIIKYLINLKSECGFQGDYPLFISGDIFELDKLNKSYDVVFNHGVYEHFLNKDDRKSALSNIYNSLNKNGRYIVAIPNLINPLFNSAISHDQVPKMAVFDSQSLQSELREAGFNILESGYLFVGPGFEQWLKTAWLAYPIYVVDKMWGIMPFFLRKMIAAHIYCVAQKS
jgi:2-polyprenyl-3-methyl-5-hydroxy-6-metoxy-1,4-benzoquinol methylase